MDRMFQILREEAGDNGDGGGGAGDGGAGGQQQPGGDGGAGAGAGGGQQQQAGGAGGNSQYVPYARFQEVNGKYKDLETKYGQMQAVLDQMKGALSPEQKKGFKLDYANPDKSIQEFVEAQLKERLDGFKKEGTERQQAAQRESAIKWFKEQEDYTPEMEEKAARFITENGLQGLDPEKAIKLAYKFVTMGDGSGYTRTVKDSLRKPGMGGKAKGFDMKAELAKLDPKDPQYEEKMKVIHAKMVGG